MDSLTFETKSDYIFFIKDLIKQIVKIEKIDSYRFIFKADNAWYYLTFCIELGQPWANGQALTLMIGDNAEKLKSVKSFLTIVQKIRYLEKFGYSLHTKQFAEEEEINAIFLQIEAKYISLSNFKIKDREKVFSSASEFLSRFTIRKLSETSFAIFYDSVYYHLNIKETYNEIKFERILVWIEKNDSNIIVERLVTNNKDLINQIFDYLTFCEYLQNTNNNNFIDIMRKVANINGK